MRLRLEQVSVWLDDHQALRAVDVTVPSGAFVSLVGPNGSGKSTLIRAAYRALRPRTGSVLVGEADVWSLSARESARRSAVVHQHEAEPAELTVEDIVAMGRTPHKSLFAPDRPADRAICAAALARVGLSDRRERTLGTLSGGERQRVLIARALAQQSPLLLLDEPTNHLDIRHQFELLALVRSLRLTTLAAVHDLNLAAQFSDYVYLLRAGAVVAAGPPAEALTPARIREVFGVDAHVTTHPVTGRPYLLLSPLSPD